MQGDSASDGVVDDEGAAGDLAEQDHGVIGPPGGALFLDRVLVDCESLDRECGTAALGRERLCKCLTEEDAGVRGDDEALHGDEAVRGALEGLGNREAALDRDHARGGAVVDGEWLERGTGRVIAVARAFEAGAGCAATRAERLLGEVLDIGEVVRVDRDGVDAVGLAGDAVLSDDRIPVGRWLVGSGGAGGCEHAEDEEQEEEAALHDGSLWMSGAGPSGRHGGVTLAATGSVPGISYASGMRPVLTRTHPVAAAHRGSRILWPENTMPAFQGAVDLGVGFLETDLHATSDGHLMTFHDRTLDRCTNGTGELSDRTLAELRALDAAANFEGEGDFPHRGNGVTVPTLEEVMTSFPDVGLVLDIKAPGVEPLLADLLVRLKAEDRVIVGSFSDRRLGRFRRLTGGAVATSSATFETLRVKASAMLRRPAASRADAFQVPARAGITVVDKAFIDAAHAAGKHVHVWTINERDEMVRLLDLGVDGLVTDRPDTLMEVLAERRDGAG